MQSLVRHLSQLFVAWFYLNQQVNPPRRQLPGRFYIQTPSNSLPQVM